MEIFSDFWELEICFQVYVIASVADPTELTEPIYAIEQIEPLDANEPLEPNEPWLDRAERAYLCDRTDRVKRADPCDRAARADGVDRAIELFILLCFTIILTEILSRKPTIQ